MFSYGTTVNIRIFMMRLVTARVTVLAAGTVGTRSSRISRGFRLLRTHRPFPKRKTSNNTTTLKSNELMNAAYEKANGSLRHSTAHGRKLPPNSKQSLTVNLSGSPLPSKIVRLGSRSILKLRDFCPIIPVLGLTDLVNPFRRRRFGRIRNIQLRTPKNQSLFNNARLLIKTMQPIAVF